jgi:SAM-dependent methyltransferase
MDRMLEVTARAEARHFWFRGLRRVAAAMITRAYPDRRRLRILDCGAGTGCNLGWLESYGEAMGVELTPVGLRAAQVAGRRIVRGTVAALPLPDATFDLATSFDVLYCLPDADETAAIAEMWRVLVPGGRVLINAAALDILHGAHSELTHEVRRYTHARLRSRLEAAGFVVERMTSTNMVTLPLTLGVRLAQRLSGTAGTPGETEMQVPPAPVNEVLNAALVAEAALIDLGISLPVGSSVMALARKPQAP